MRFPDDFANIIQYSGGNLTSLKNFSEAEEIIASGDPVFKTIDEDILNNQIAQIANAIRYVTGYQGNFTFPRGIIGAINAMSEEASLVYVSGTYIFNNTTNPEISGYWTGKLYSSNSTDSTTVYALVDGTRFNEIRLNAPGNAEYWELLLYDTEDTFMPAYDSNYHGFPATITFPPCYIDAELWSYLGNVLSY
jgi:hypothetical protein